MIYLIPFFVILLDQLSKIYIVQSLALHEVLPVLPFFNLFFVFNRGISFSILTNDLPAMPWILSGLAIIISGWIVYWMQHEKRTVTRIGLALALGGAIGNVIDRIRFGAVVDFLDFYIGDYHWPAFNIADSAICIGFMIIIVQSLLKEKKK